MRRWLPGIVVTIGIVTLGIQFGIAGDKARMETNPKIAMETSLGTITVALWAEKAPKTVANFLGLDPL